MSWSGLLFGGLVLGAVVVVAAGLMYAGGDGAPPSPGGDVNEPPVSGGGLGVGVTILPFWKTGEYGSVDLAPYGGTPGYRCTLKERSAPPERFIVSEDCTISGRAPVLSAGTTSDISPPFTVIVSDSGDPGESIEVTLRIVTVSSAPVLTTYTAGKCEVDEACVVRVASAEEGAPPYAFMSDDFSQGTPPMGMIVDMSGYLKGKPKRAGQYFFGVCVKDTVGSKTCRKAAVTIEEKPEPTTTVKTRTTITLPGPDCSHGHHWSRCQGGGVRCCLNGWDCCGSNCKPSGWC